MVGNHTVHSTSSRSTDGNGNKENPTRKGQGTTAPVTRSRAKAMGVSAGDVPLLKLPFKRNQKRVLRANHKRGASDENKASVIGSSELLCKRRAVLKDVSNLCVGGLYIGCQNGTKIQVSKQMGKSVRIEKKDTDVVIDSRMDGDAVKTKLAEELSRIRVVEPVDTAYPNTKAREEERSTPKILEATTVGLEVVDIDSNLKDPQICGLYAPDIYDKLRVAELERRASTDYMERVQRDITPSMRRILIDWLVEVSEEYKLVPDTLYLSVNLIDRFLSENHVEKHRLQLLGVTCMLIASKYEETCAPRVEEFCLITDNTYRKSEIVFSLSDLSNNDIERAAILQHRLIDTLLNGARNGEPRTELSAFSAIRAHHEDILKEICSSGTRISQDMQVPSVEMEFLANYLAELTLVEYNFLKFLPSLIAASAVFLARCILDQSNRPWNPTLEYYTAYEVTDLKDIVVAMEELHLKTSACTQNAIREKYKQKKFKGVATMNSSVRVLTHFTR